MSTLWEHDDRFCSRHDVLPRRFAAASRESIRMRGGKRPLGRPQADADALAPLMIVVVVAGGETEHLGAARQPQGVQELGTAKYLGEDLGTIGALVVVNDVVGPDQ